MPGSKAGGKKAAATNIERHGEDFYRRIGSMGGSRTGTKPKGFAANLELARIAGAKGGRISKRTAGGKTRSDKGGHHMKRSSIYWETLRKEH